MSKQPERPFAISPAWQPDPELIEQLLENMGKKGWQYSREDVGEFANYWGSRPEKQFTHTGWHHKFIQNKAVHGQRSSANVGFTRPEPPSEGKLEYCWSCVKLMRQYGHLTDMRDHIPGILEQFA